MIIKAAGFAALLVAGTAVGMLIAGSWTLGLTAGH